MPAGVIPDRHFQVLLFRKVYPRAPHYGHSAVSQGIILTSASGLNVTNKRKKNLAKKIVFFSQEEANDFFDFVIHIHTIRNCSSGRTAIRLRRTMCAIILKSS